MTTPDFAAITDTIEAGPILGHLVLYSVVEGDVTLDQLTTWFTELGLDSKRLPPTPRAVDAFERITGRDGVRSTYALDDPAADWREMRRRNMHGRTATLMVRHVRADGGKIVRRVIREVRDEEQTSLAYDPHMADVIFVRANDVDAAGAGRLDVAARTAAINQLPEAEQARVREMLADLEQAYQRRCRFLGADRLRSLLRDYVETGLDAIRVRPTGGVYFVHRDHADTLAALRELVSRTGRRSSLTRVPLPDQDEMREMVITAFTTRTADDLAKLGGEIVRLRSDPTATAAAREKLWQRYAALRDATKLHTQRLATSMDDTQTTLELVQAQLKALLSADTKD